MHACQNSSRLPIIKKIGPNLIEVATHSATSTGIAPVTLRGRLVYALSQSWGLRLIKDNTYQCLRASFIMLNAIITLTALACVLAFQLTGSTLLGLVRNDVLKPGELLTVGPHSQQSLLTPRSNLCTTRISDMNGWWGRFNL